MTKENALEQSNVWAKAQTYHESKGNASLAKACEANKLEYLRIANAKL
jgi:hypothetical protein